MERDCNKCVYSSRDGNCRKWECKGTVTVEDIRKEAIKDFAEEIKDYIIEHRSFEEGITTEEIDLILCEFEKEQKNE